MSRARKILVYGLLILALGVFYMRSMQKYFTPEAVFYACEKGLHYGPSEEILYKLERDRNHVTVIGRWKDGLSIVETERRILLWGLGDGMITGYAPPRENEDIVIAYNRKQGVVYGIANNSDISYIEGTIGTSDKDAGDFRAEVEENGFFITEALKTEDDDYCYIRQANGFDDQGNEVDKYMR